MKRQLLALLVIAFLAWLMTLSSGSRPGSAAVGTAFMIGFVLLSAHLLGVVGERLSLPRITGYICTGLLFGPWALGLLTPAIQTRMEIFNHMAYAFIGLAAGSELELGLLRQRARSVLALITCTVTMVFVGVSATAFLLRGWLPFMAEGSTSQVLAMCALIGIIATARSPSSAIAVISETRARGPFCEIILGVSMAMDLLIIPMFFVMVAVAGPAFDAGARLELALFATLFAQISGSIMLGVLVGAAVAMYIKRRGPQLALILIGICFLVYKLLAVLEIYLETHGVAVQLEPLLICAAAGFTIRNFSHQGEHLAQALGSVGLPVYVVFFTLAGAGLDIGALRSGLLVALVLATARVLMITFGSRVATRLAGDPPLFRRYCWMGFVTQAGLSIALAGQLANAFPGWGGQACTLLVGIIALNQIVGPVLFLRALEGVGETHRARRAEIRRAAAAAQEASG